ncbi:MAG: hydrogen peroxide-inducible genes activator [Candidatus Accumulibacter sp.]|jgi:LysR family hydrogen peroxide-inducible transcriptional activator|nr:hydrogen peroxide-inducible genes activator [Accumulibacter sp.]
MESITEPHMSFLPSLKQLQYLIALSEHLNFNRAAEACFVTQSTLSAGLKELERLLGRRLVERDRQTVLMTPLGMDIVRRAHAILTAAQDLVDLVAADGDAVSGTLRLGVIPTIAPFLLPKALPLLRKRHPGLRLMLREDLSANLLTRMEHGQIDFALLALPYDTNKFMTKSLFDDPLWIVGAKNDPLLSEKNIRLTPKIVERLLLLEEGHCLRDHVLFACNKPERKLSGQIEATSLLTLVEMVNSGFGLGLIPEMAVKSGLASGAELVVRPVIKPRPSRTIALAARRSTPRLGEMEALADAICQAHLQNALPEARPHERPH